MMSLLLIQKLVGIHGVTHLATYIILSGLLVMCDDYLTIKIDESIDDALDALKVYEQAPNGN